MLMSQSQVIEIYQAVDSCDVALPCKRCSGLDHVFVTQNTWRETSSIPGSLSFSSLVAEERDPESPSSTTREEKERERGVLREKSHFGLLSILPRHSRSH